MKFLDRWFDRAARGVARSTSRRSFLARLGLLLVGSATFPLLPVARGAQGEPDPATPEGDPKSCDYWRHCAIDGFACSCCGGSQRSCPPGTEQSPITWIGTCRNPADGLDYIISYNDCCGKDVCGRCYCHNNEGDRPIYNPPRSNDVNWCVGAKVLTYNCSTAVVLGVAKDS